MEFAKEIITPYILISLLLMSASGLGKIIIDITPSNWKNDPTGITEKLRHPTEVTLGLAFLILISIVFLKIQIHSKQSLLAPLTLGIIYFAYKSTKIKIKSDIYTICAIIFFSSTLVAPLTLPLEWDELMYHLPHARAWSENGNLSINENLRYPYFPYNINLLYTLAFEFGFENLPHFIHASFGWITGWFIFSTATIWHSRFSAALATSMWFIVSTAYYKNAYIDLGLTLFIFTSFVYFTEWTNSRVLYKLWLSCIFFGFALGSKYQAIFFAFPLVIFFAIKRPTIKEFIIGIAGISIGSIYWYARNIIDTGNPVNPLAEKLFGYYDWNSSDILHQFSDLKRVQENPTIGIAVLMAILINHLYFKNNNSAHHKTLTYYSVLILTAWASFSRYARYLLPAMPAILIITSNATENLTNQISKLKRIIILKIEKFLLIILIILGAVYSTWLAIRWQKRIGFDETRIENITTDRVKGYSTWKSLGNTSSKVYQFYLEGSIYYAPKNTYGDHFGPWRYTDYSSIAADQLHQKLRSESFDILVISNTSKDLIEEVDLYTIGFEKIMTNSESTAYKIN